MFARIERDLRAALVVVKGYISSGEELEDQVIVAGVPARRRIDILQFSTRPVVHVRSTISSSAGEYRVSGLDPSIEHCVIAREDRNNRVFNDVIKAGIFPQTDE